MRRDVVSGPALSLVERQTGPVKVPVSEDVRGATAVARLMRAVIASGGSIADGYASIASAIVWTPARASRGRDMCPIDEGRSRHDEQIGQIRA